MKKTAIVLFAVSLFGCDDQQSDGEVVHTMRDASVVPITAAIEGGSLELSIDGARFTHPNDSVVDEITDLDSVTLRVERTDDWDGMYNLRLYTADVDGTLVAWDDDELVIPVSETGDTELRFLAVASNGVHSLARDPIVFIVYKPKK